MTTASIRVHGALERFVARGRRGVAFSHACARAATLKQTIESVGVPHTEVGLVTVNGLHATLARIVREGDFVEAYPYVAGTAPFEEPLAFIADAHLGGLAHMLRMLGFDTIYDHALHDAQIAASACAERRVVLTRDRELLKRREVLRGAYVHALKPEAQLREVAARYALAGRARPFTLCLHCNLLLAPPPIEVISEQVPPRIRALYREFMHCSGCRRVYWEGSHWEHMRAVLAHSLEVAPERLA